MPILSLLTALFPADDPQVVYATIIADVARLIRFRTYDTSSTLTDTFTDDTDPKAAVVEKLIEDAAVILAGSIDLSRPIPEKGYPFARRIVALWTAYEIERGSEEFDPERTRMLREDAQAARGQLLEAMQDLAEDGDPTRVNEQRAAFSFPAAVPYDW